MSATTFEPRYYQKEAIEAIRKKRKTKGKRALIVVPTGAGKTLIAAEESHEELRKKNGKVLILAHRKKLLKQMKKELLFLDPSADIGIVGFGIEEWGHKITLAGVQTLWSSKERLERIRSEKFTYVITDEAHHVLSPGYQLIHKYLADDNDELFAAGITATSDRGDGRDVSEFYGTAVYTVPILELIDHPNKYLCNLKTFVIKTRTSLKNVKQNGVNKDYNQKELEFVVNCEDRNQMIVQSWFDEELGGPDIATVSFCAGREHALELARVSNAMGISAIALLDDTPEEDKDTNDAHPISRDQIYRDFASGKLKVITNVGVCEEGWDADVRRVCLCAPTQVRAKYAQRIGRGTRNAPGKDFCYIIDYSDDVATHNLEPVSLEDVFEMPIANGELITEASEKEKKRRAENAETEAERQEILKELTRNAELVNKKVDILGNLPWQRFKDSGYRVSVDNSSLFLIPAKKPGEYYACMEFQRDAGGPKSHQVFNNSNPLPLSWSMAIVEQKARQLQAGAYSLVDPNAAWKKKPISKSQLEFLTKMQRNRLIDSSIAISMLTQEEANTIISLKKGKASIRRNTKPKRKTS